MTLTATSKTERNVAQAELTSKRLRPVHRTIRLATSAAAPTSVSMPFSLRHSPADRTGRQSSASSYNDPQMRRAARRSARAGRPRSESSAAWRSTRLSLCLRFDHRQDQCDYLESKSVASADSFCFFVPLGGCCEAVDRGVPQSGAPHRTAAPSPLAGRRPDLHRLDAILAEGCEIDDQICCVCQVSAGAFLRIEHGFESTDASGRHPDFAGLFAFRAW